MVGDALQVSAAVRGFFLDRGNFPGEVGGEIYHQIEALPYPRVKTRSPFKNPQLALRKVVSTPPSFFPNPDFDVSENFTVNPDVYGVDW